MAIKCIRVHNGYVESRTIAVLEFYPPTGSGLETRYEALKQLAGMLWSHYKYYIIDDRVLKKCCESPASIGKKFCADCGTKLIDDTWPKQFQEFIRYLHGGDADSTGSLWETLNDTGWSFDGDPFGLKQSEALCIDTYGSDVIFLATCEIDWPSDDYQEAFLKYVNGDRSGLPYWWGKGECDKDIKEFKKRVNGQKF
jgi:hypothetical protein